MTGKTYTASRLAEGNQLFPPQIILEEEGLRVKMPGFFKNKEKFLYYSDISSVETNTPIIGFTTLWFNVQGIVYSIHGFTKKEVADIKDAIDFGRERSKHVRVVD